MRILVSIFFYFSTAALFCQEKQRIKFSYPLHNTHDTIFYSYTGKVADTIHHLTFYNDSMFHITVPNNSGSCHTWGEYGGKIKIIGDTIVFYKEETSFKENRKPTRRNFKKDSSYETVIKSAEIFVLKNNDNALERISKEQFMLSKYELESFIKGK
jgi:hypothetical protein